MLKWQILTLWNLDPVPTLISHKIKVTEKICQTQTFFVNWFHETFSSTTFSAFSTMWKIEKFHFFPWNQLFNFFHSSVKKSLKTRSPFFRQINGFTIEVTNELNSRKFLSVIAFYCTFPHCGFFSNYVAFTKHFAKKVWE